MVADADEDIDELEEGVEGEEGEEGAELEEEGSSGGFGLKKIILFVVVPLLLLGGIGAGLYFSGFFDEPEPTLEEVEEQILMDDKTTGIFFDIPDIIVNLNAPGRKPRFLKISISLELAKQEDEKIIEEILPRVLDHFQTYLRELREEDLRGSAGIYRLRLELLARVNAAAHPQKVRDVLFREILVQ
ncbi:MAG: flagellar basal body protein FliL [Rickettsiales bacterium]|nr:flagellar basal body protein FliL [Rickettsiales bacterium]